MWLASHRIRNICFLFMKCCLCGSGFVEMRIKGSEEAQAGGRGRRDRRRKKGSEGKMRRKVGYWERGEEAEKRERESGEGRKGEGADGQGGGRGRRRRKDRGPSEECDHFRTYFRGLKWWKNIRHLKMGPVDMPVYMIRKNMVIKGIVLKFWSATFLRVSAY